MGKNASEVDKVVEQVQELSAARAFPTIDHPAAGRFSFDQVFEPHDRLDNADTMVDQELFDLVANGT